MAKLGDLPTELISRVTDFLEISDLASFAQTARRFYPVADHALYKRATGIDCDPVWHHTHPLRWAAENGIAGTIGKCIAAGFDVDKPLDATIDQQTRNSLCFQRRVEALEGEQIWERELPINKAPPGRGGTEDPAPVRSWEPTPVATPRPRHHNLSKYQCECTLRALHLAVVGGHDEAVEVLLDHGADIDAPCKNVCDCPSYADRPHLDTRLSTIPVPVLATTPLHLAICHFRDSTAKLLLRWGASIQMTEPSLPYNATALHAAAATGQATLCRYLLDEGYVQDVDILDSRMYGLTPLYWACYNGHWKTTVSELLERGANINFWLPLEATGDAELPPDPSDSFDDPVSTTLLYKTCESGRFEDALKLVRLGADVNKGQRSGGTVMRTPLHAACSNSSTRPWPPFNPPIQLSKTIRGGEDLRCQLIQVFVQEVIDIDAVSHDGLGHTPLYEAASYHLVAAVETLLAAGADVNFQTCDNSTPFLGACRSSPHWDDRTSFGSASLRGHPRDCYHTVKLLLDHGSKVTAKHGDGYTALHTLCQRSVHKGTPEGFVETRVVRLLLDRGADVSARNSDGRTAFQEAFQAGHLNICDIILRYRKVAQPLTFKEVDEMVACVVSSTSWGPEYFQMLLDLDTDNHLTSTAQFIMQLCDQSNYNAVDSYLERKPPRLDAAQKSKILFVAVRQKRTHLVKRMLALKAPVNRLDETGHPPLYTAVAVYESSEALTTLTKGMLAAGASIHLRGGMDTLMTPLRNAIAHQRTNSIKLMLRHRPLCDDPEAPKGVYLHAAVALGPDGREIVDLLLGSGATLTELDANGDTPLGSFLKSMINLGGCYWLSVQNKSYEQTADQVCAMIQHLWTEDIDIRAKNRADKSIMGYLAALKLYQGDNMVRVQVASQLRQRVKVVTVAGSRRPEHATLEFHPLPTLPYLDGGDAR